MTITDEHFQVNQYPDDPTVWSVGVLLPTGEWVGVAVHDASLIPAAKEQIRLRCEQILNERAP